MKYYIDQIIQGRIAMNQKEEFIQLLEAGAFKTDSGIEDYADDHSLPTAEVWRWFSEYRDACLIKQAIGTPCEGCKYVTQIEGLTSPCYECCRNKADFYTKAE